MRMRLTKTDLLQQVNKVTKSIKIVRGGEGSEPVVPNHFPLWLWQREIRPASRVLNKIPAWKHPSSPLRENFASLWRKAFSRTRRVSTLQMVILCIWPYSLFNWNFFLAQVREGVHVTQGVLILRNLKIAWWAWRRQGEHIFFFSKLQLGVFSEVDTVFEWYFVDQMLVVRGRNSRSSWVSKTSN